MAIFAWHMRRFFWDDESSKDAKKVQFIDKKLIINDAVSNTYSTDTQLIFLLLSVHKYKFKIFQEKEKWYGYIKYLIS